jgi:hypothetical protein
LRPNISSAIALAFCGTLHCSIGWAEALATLAAINRPAAPPRALRISGEVNR